MAGHKTFVNGTDLQLAVTIFVRSGDSPEDQAGQQTFGLAAGHSVEVAYGNDRDIYLNGMEVDAMAGGAVIGQEEFVARRGSPYDDVLNKNSVVVISRQGDAFHIASHN